jgi:uncharacterized SAM-binding protein YcdF (DUF218 family)
LIPGDNVPFNTYSEPILPLLIVFGFVAVFRLPRNGRRTAAIAAMCGFVMISWPPFDWLFSYPLEGHYPVRPIPATPKPQAIVVQSASVNKALFERPYQLPGFETYQRCEFTAWLHSIWPDLPVITSGGSGPKPSALVMQQFLSRSGVPAEQIIVEGTSQTTYQSAVACARILKDRGITRIALVVEGQSMLRATACFRKQGIDVIPAPSEIRQLGEPWQEEILPTWRAIRRNELTLHEMGGLVWYRLKGRV